LSFPLSGIQIADISGFLALIFITATAVLMFVKKRLFERYTSRKSLIKNIHIVAAALGGIFLVMHGDYFILAPITNFGILLGYLGTGVGLIVWFTGFSFLERLRYSLLYHGSLSLFAIALMVIHSVNLGFSIPLWLGELLLAVTGVVAIVRGFQHVLKIMQR
jgi:hypothetical protein